MSDQNNAPEVRSEEPELNDDALEQVAGGCQWGDSMTQTKTIIDPIVIIEPILTTGPILLES
jgi:hypothetical protein